MSGSAVLFTFMARMDVLLEGEATFQGAVDEEHHLGRGNSIAPAMWRLPTPYINNGEP